MKNLSINVPDMQSTHCQTIVGNAIKTIAGVEVQHVEAGNVSVSLENDRLESEVVETIKKAGYTVEAVNESNP